MKKRKGRVIQMYDGDGIEICKDSHWFRLKCCQCGLVHRIDIERQESGIILRFREVGNGKT